MLWKINSCWALKASPSDDDEDICVGVSCGRAPCAFTPNCCFISWTMVLMLKAMANGLDSLLCRM